MIMRVRVIGRKVTGFFFERGGLLYPGNANKYVHI